MRNAFFIGCIVLVISLAQCATQQKIEYNIPENLTVIQQEELKVNLDKGLKLYKPNCSGCHGIFAKGKDGIPNFTAKQLDLYKARHNIRDSGNHAFAMKIPPEDLDAILVFLFLRKKPETNNK